jgi:hypothetical protein
MEFWYFVRAFHNGSGMVQILQLFPGIRRSKVCFYLPCCCSAIFSPDDEELQLHNIVVNTHYSASRSCLQPKDKKESDRYYWQLDDSAMVRGSSGVGDRANMRAACTS